MNRLLLFLLTIHYCGFTNAQELDPTFGTNGVVIADSDGGDEDIEALVLQPDGKILVMGDSFTAGDGDFFVMRFAANGDVDLDFGENGLVHQLFSDVLNDSAEDAVPLGDGKILVLGRMIYSGALVPVLVRLNSDGSLDTSFQGNGYQTYPFVNGVNTYIKTIHLLSDDDIWMTGRLADLGNAETYLIRLWDDFNPDLSFGFAGHQTIDLFGSFDTVEGSIILEDGSVIGVGWSFVGSGGNDQLIAVKYTPTGELDETFGDNGVVEVADSGGQDVYLEIARYGNDHFLAAGYINPDGNRDIIISRYDFNGNPDVIFGNMGHVVLDNMGFDDQAIGVAELSDGSIIVGARTETGDGENDDFALVKLNSDGSLDESFGSNGWFIHDETPGDNAERMVLQPDGKVVLVGSVQSGAGEDIMMIRVMEVDPVSVAETANSAAFQLSPNPARSLLRVSGDQVVQHFTILSAEGRLVKQIAARTLPFDIDIADLAPGHYFLQMNGISKPFVKVE